MEAGTRRVCLEKAAHQAEVVIREPVDRVARLAAFEIDRAPERSTRISTECTADAQHRLFSALVQRCDCAAILEESVDAALLP